MPRTCSPSRSCSRRHGQSLYPGLLEWVSLSDGGKVTRVDPATNTFETDFGSHKADVGNVIPPQRAGAIAALAGVADRTGWCPIDPVTFEVEAAARHPCDRRRGDRRRDAEIRVRRERAGEGVRRMPWRSCWPATRPPSRG